MCQIQRKPVLTLSNFRKEKKRKELCYIAFYVCPENTIDLKYMNTDSIYNHRYQSLSGHYHSFATQTL